MGPFLYDEAARAGRNLTGLGSAGKSQRLSQKSKSTQKTAPEADCDTQTRTCIDGKITQELMRLFSPPLKG
jgi:hypothetical protein